MPQPSVVARKQDETTVALGILAGFLLASESVDINARIGTDDSLKAEKTSRPIREADALSGGALPPILIPESQSLA